MLYRYEYTKNKIKKPDESALSPSKQSAIIINQIKST